MMRITMAFAAACLVAAAPAAAQYYPRYYPAVPGADAPPLPPGGDAPPLPPGGAAVGFTPPEHDGGGYRTPNRDLTAAEVAWHVRVALNVAALGCRDQGDLSGDYNDLLEAERAPLADALVATRSLYRLRHGAMVWEARYDDDMTRLYNYWAQPPAHDGFCATAAALLREAHGVTPAQFAGFAAYALPRLEAPFVAFYAAYDDYRVRLGAWRERRPAMVIATAAPVAMGPVAP